MRWEFVLLSSLIGCLAGPLPGLADNLTTVLNASFAEAVEQELRVEAQSAATFDQQQHTADSYPLLDMESGLAAADSIFPDNEDYLVAFSPAPEIDLYAGYRFRQKDVFKCDITADVKFDGPYVGAMIRY